MGFGPSGPTVRESNDAGHPRETQCPREVAFRVSLIRGNPVNALSLGVGRGFVIAWTLSKLSRLNWPVRTGTKFSKPAVFRGVNL